MKAQQPSPNAHGPGYITGKDQIDIPQWILDQSSAGVGRAARGIEGIAGGKTRREKAGSLHEVIAGTTQAATPAMLGVEARAPAKTALTVASSVVSQEAVERGLVAMGLPKEYASVAGDLAAVIVGAKVSGAIEAIDKATPGGGVGGKGKVAEIKAKVEPILKERMAAAGKPLRPPLKKPVAPPETPPPVAPAKVEAPPSPPQAQPPSSPPVEDPELNAALAVRPSSVQSTPPHQLDIGPPEVNAPSAAPSEPVPTSSAPPPAKPTNPTPPPPGKYAGGDTEFAGKVSKARAIKASAERKSAVPQKKAAKTPAPAPKAKPAHPPTPPPTEISQGIVKSLTAKGIPKSLLVEVPGANLKWTKKIGGQGDLETQVLDVIRQSQAQGYKTVTIQPVNMMGKPYGEPISFQATPEE